MSPSPFLTHLSAVLDTPDEARLEQFKTEGWTTALWMMGRMEEHPNGQVAMSFCASQLDDTDRPVLFAYVDETQARAHHPEESFISYPLGVVGLLAQQQALDMAIVDGDEHVVLSHEQFLALRDLMLLGTDQVVRSTMADDRFVRDFEPFLKQARDYCQRTPEVVRLHLAAVSLGGAPMRAAGILKAAHRQVHLDALQDMFGRGMEPGDQLSFLDSLDASERKLIEAIEQTAPVYVREEKQGWWARLMSRNRRPQLVVVTFDLASDKA